MVTPLAPIASVADNLAITIGLVGNPGYEPASCAALAACVSVRRTIGFGSQNLTRSPAQWLFAVPRSGATKPPDGKCNAPHQLWPDIPGSFAAMQSRRASTPASGIWPVPLRTTVANTGERFGGDVDTRITLPIAPDKATTDALTTHLHHLSVASFQRSVSIVRPSRFDRARSLSFPQVRGGGGRGPEESHSHQMPRGAGVVQRIQPVRVTAGPSHAFPWD